MTADEAKDLVEQYYTDTMKINRFVLWWMCRCLNQKIRRAARNGEDSCFFYYTSERAKLRYGPAMKQVYQAQGFDVRYGTFDESLYVSWKNKQNKKGE